jgi:hypothetical protein
MHGITDSTIACRSFFWKYSEKLPKARDKNLLNKLKSARSPIGSKSRDHGHDPWWRDGAVRIQGIEIGCGKIARQKEGMDLVLFRQMTHQQDNRELTRTLI